jgi:hypothetical protein
MYVTTLENRTVLLLLRLSLLLDSQEINDSSSSSSSSSTVMLIDTTESLEDKSFIDKPFSIENCNLGILPLSGFAALVVQIFLLHF